MPAISPFKVLALIFGLAGCTGTPKGITNPMTHQIKPTESIKVLEHFTILHEGYGHRIMQNGDRSFFTFAVSDKTGSTQFREYLPVEPKHSFEWKNLSVRMLACEDDGPPHNAEAKVTFEASLLKTIRPGETYALHAGQAVYLENGPTLKVKAFGHDDDDSGGQTVADLLISFETSSSSLMMFNSTKQPMIQRWQDWEVQNHRWLEPGPPHGPEQAIVVSIKRRGSKTP